MNKLKDTKDTKNTSLLIDDNILSNANYRITEWEKEQQKEYIVKLLKGIYLTKDDLSEFETKLDTKYQPVGQYALQVDLAKYQPLGQYALESELKAYQPVGQYALESELKAYQPVGQYALESELSNYQSKLVKPVTSVTTSIPMPMSMSMTSSNPTPLK